MNTLSLNVPNKSSTGLYWAEWHKALVQSVGRKQANQLFIQAWAVRKGDNANTSDLRQYLETQGIKLSSDSVIGVIEDFAADTMDVIGDVFAAGKTVAIVIGIVLLAAVIMVVYNLTKNPESIKAMKYVA